VAVAALIQAQAQVEMAAAQLALIQHHLTQPQTLAEAVAVHQILLALMVVQV
jgi:hypothetical protein